MSLARGNPCHEQFSEKVPGEEVKPPLSSHLHELGEDPPAPVTASETSVQTVDRDPRRDLQSA